MAGSSYRRNRLHFGRDPKPGGLAGATPISVVPTWRRPRPMPQKEMKEWQL